MTSKERMLIAMCGGQADHVPVCPDISNMIPCRLTGKSFEQIYLHNNPPLGRAYVEAVKYFGFDGWYWYWNPQFHWKSRSGVEMRYESQVREMPEGRFEETTLCHLGGTTLRQRMLYYPGDPPTKTEKVIKDVERDLPEILRWFDADLADVDWRGGQEDYDSFGDLGIWGIMLECPGPPMWFEWFDGGLEAAIMAAYDHPELMEQWCSIHHRRIVDVARACLAAPMTIDYICIGASGLITMSNPELFRKYSLPTVKEVTRLCKQAGMPTMLHSCGKSKLLVETFPAETDLDCLNPLEAPPMGDITLAEAKRIANGRMSLMGNLHTTDVMLFGSVQDVERACRQAIDDAGEGGGFILSTGDQCGRDTPDENIRAMVRVGREYGKYA